jgi:hypothetical protein
MQVVVFFFNYPMQFSDILQFFLLKEIPKYVLMFLNAPLFFMASFASMMYIVENFMPIFLQFLRDVIMLQTENYYVNMMYALVIFFFVYDCVVLIKNFKTLKYSISNIMRLFSMPITMFLLGIFQFIITLGTAVPFGAVLCLIICLIISTAVLWYPFFSMDPNKIVGILDIPYNIFFGTGPIYDYLHTSFLLDFDVNDKGTTYVQRVQYLFAVIFDFFCSNMFIITTLVLMGISIKDFNYISNPMLKNNLLKLNGFIMVGVIGYLIIKFNDKLTENRKATSKDLETLNADKEQSKSRDAEISAEEMAGFQDLAEKAGVKKFDVTGALKDPNKAKQDMTNNIIDGKVGELKGLFANQIPAGLQEGLQQGLPAGLPAGLQEGLPNMSDFMKK